MSSSTDFTVLIDGASGPEPHPSFIEGSNPTAVGNGCWQVAGAGAGWDDRDQRRWGNRHRQLPPELNWTPGHCRDARSRNHTLPRISSSANTILS
jgi:hypothetical protein